MEIGETLYVATRGAWKKWLEKNHAKKKDVWLIYYRKESGKPRISYNDAVEMALCYGWIDSIVKKVDDEKFAQRFSPRKPRSVLSGLNRERMRKLAASGEMTEAGLKAVAGKFDPLKETASDTVEADREILDAIRADKAAWKHFQKLTDAYKRVRIAYIESRRRHGREMFEKSLRYFVKMTARNKRFGFAKDME